MKMRYRLFAGMTLLLPAAAWAQVQISTGVSTDIPTIMDGIISLLLMWSSMVATAIFLMGATLMVGSGGNDAYLSAGKKLMKAAMIGYAIILSSWLILSTAVYFIAGA
jgi:hypothetical protein